MPTKKAFWADASKKTAVWAAVATLAGVVADHLQDGSLLDNGGLDTHHWWAIALATAIRAVVALIQGNTGDGTTATFTKPAPIADDPAE